MPLLRSTKSASRRRTLCRYPSIQMTQWGTTDGSRKTVNCNTCGVTPSVLTILESVVDEISNDGVSACYPKTYGIER